MRIFLLVSFICYMLLLIGCFSWVSKLVSNSLDELHDKTAA